MVFKDYYQILEISSEADSSEIKAAYRKQALKWHPDKHPDMDVKSIMQDINEAYAVLKDPEKRKRYDQEYILFKKAKHSYDTEEESSKSSNKHNEKRQNHYSNYSETDSGYRWAYDYDYDVKNDDLKEDIKNAREYANNLVNDFFNELKRNSKLAAEGAWQGVKGYVYSLIFLIIIGLMIRACIS